MTQKKLTVPFLTLRPGEYSSVSDAATAIIRYNLILNRLEVSLDSSPYAPLGAGGDGYLYDQLVAAPQVEPLLDGYVAYIDGYSSEINKVSIEDILSLGVGGGVASVGASSPLASSGGANPVISFPTWPADASGALSNDGYGNLSWSAAPSTPPGGPADSVQVNDGYGNFMGYSGLTWDNSQSTLTAPVLALAEGIAPTSTSARGKLWANSAASARPYWIDETGQVYNLTLDRFNTLTPAATVVIDADPSLPVFNSISIDQNTTFTTDNLGPGRSASVRVVCDGTTRSLTFPTGPGGWTWLGSGPPAVLAAGDIGYLSITAYGTADAEVVAAWSYENMPSGISGTGINDQVAIWSGAYAQDGSANFTFNGSNLGLVGGISQSGGAVNLAANAASGLTTSSGALTLTSAAAATWSTNAGNLTIVSASSLQLAAALASEVVVNDSGLASNFRVESDTNANMLFVNGGNDRVGIGTATPLSALDLASGQLAIPDGTAAAPAIAFRDELNNGIFSPATDIFGIAVNGTEVARFQQFGAGNTPVMLLGTSNASGAITVDSSDASGTAGVVMLAHAAAGTVIQESYRGGQFAGVRSRGTKAAPTAVGAGDGLVDMLGGGWTATAGINYGGLVTVKAEQSYTSTASGGRVEIHTTLNGTDGYTTLGGTATERMRIANDGRVAIGQSGGSIIPAAAGSILTLAGGLTQSAGAVSLTGNAASSFTTSAGDLTLTGGVNLQLAAGFGSAVIVNEFASNVDFRVESQANANMLFVDASANAVGIGTGTPSSLLSVGASSQFQVDSSGNLARINNIPYTFPSAQGAAGTILTNDGYGALSWAENAAQATSAPISTKSSNYTLTTADGTILVDAISGGITITLPAAASAAETIFTIKKKDVTSNIVTVDANGAELIDGSTTYTLSTQYETIKIQSDGSAWWII